MKPTNSEKTRAVSDALTAVIQDHRVLTDSGYGRLVDCNWIGDEGRIYFHNSIAVPDSVFLKHGLKPIPEDYEPYVNDGDVVIWFAYQDAEGNPPPGRMIDPSIGLVSFSGC